MKARLRQWADRIDALELRERALLLFAAVIVIYLLVDALGLKPVLKSQQTTQQAIADLELKLSGLRQQSRLLADGTGKAPLQVQRDHLAAELRALDRTINGRLGALAEPAQATRLLEQMLARQPGLQLISLQAGAQAMELADEPPSAPVDGWGRYVLELQLAGDYLATLRYLQALEAMPWKFFWQQVEFSVDDYPKAHTSLKLYTLGARNG